MVQSAGEHSADVLSSTPSQRQRGGAHLVTVGLPSTSASSSHKSTVASRAFSDESNSAARWWSVIVCTGLASLDEEKQSVMQDGGTDSALPILTDEDTSVWYCALKRAAIMGIKGTMLPCSSNKKMLRTRKCSVAHSNSSAMRLSFLLTSSLLTAMARCWGNLS